MRRLAWRLLVALPLVASAPFLGDSPTWAQDALEADLLFQRGNQLLQEGMALRGRRRAQRLGDALAAYLESYDITENPNVAFNAAVCLEALDRPVEAFAFFQRYLRFDGLSDSDVSVAEQRLDALRPEVYLLSVETSPAGAELRVGRREVAPSGQTPAEIPLGAGNHRVFLHRPGFAEASFVVRAAVGESATREVTLEPVPVPVVFEGPEGYDLIVDGTRVELGSRVALMPGSHEVSYGPLDQVLDIEPSGELLRVPLDVTPPSPVGTLAVRVDRAAEIRVDGVTVTEGTTLSRELSAGEHDFEVRSPGYRSASSSLAIVPDETLEVFVILAEDAETSSSLGYWPEAFWVAAGLDGLVAVVFAALAAQAGSEYEDALQTPATTDARRRALREDVLRNNTIADVAGFAAAGIAGEAFVLTLLDEDVPATESTIRLGTLPAGAP